MTDTPQPRAIHIESLLNSDEAVALKTQIQLCECRFASAVEQLDITRGEELDSELRQLKSQLWKLFESHLQQLDQHKAVQAKNDQQPNTNQNTFNQAIKSANEKLIHIIGTYAEDILLLQTFEQKLLEARRLRIQENEAECLEVRSECEAAEEALKEAMLRVEAAHCESSLFDAQAEAFASVVEVELDWVRTAKQQVAPIAGSVHSSHALMTHCEGCAWALRRHRA